MIVASANDRDQGASWRTMTRAPMRQQMLAMLKGRVSPSPLGKSTTRASDQRRDASFSNDTAP